MDRAALTRMQIRVVLTVYRAELARLADRYPREERDRALARLRERSLTLLDDARARLDGEAPIHPDLLAELAAARLEVSDGDERQTAAGLTPGSLAGRPG